MWNEVGRPCLNGNSLLKRACKLPPTTSSRLRLFEIDVLEPFETLWEFYCNRDDILLELFQKGAKFAKRNSVRAAGTLLIACSVAQALALIGILGKRGEGLGAFLSEHDDELREYGVERVLQKTAAGLTNVGVTTFKTARKLGAKSKFAVAMSVGAIFTNAAVDLTTFGVKVLITSFLVVEGLSFAGVIGEPGESFLSYLRDHDTKKDREWVKKTRRIRDTLRKNVSLDAFETFYEAAVDEEKVACAGFAIGSVISMFT